MFYGLIACAGYEDELYCPAGTCIRDKNMPPGFTGPRTRFFECFEESTGSKYPPRGWGFKLEASYKQDLLAKGYHLPARCPGAADGGDLEEAGREQEEREGRADAAEKRERDEEQRYVNQEQAGLNQDGPDPTIEDYMSESAFALNKELHGIIELRNAFFPADQHAALPRSLPYPAELTRLLQSLLPGRPAIADCLRGRFTAEALSAVRAELQALLAGNVPPDACAAPPRPTR